MAVTVVSKVTIPPVKMKPLCELHLARAECSVADGHSEINLPPNVAVGFCETCLWFASFVLFFCACVSNSSTLSLSQQKLYKVRRRPTFARWRHLSFLQCHFAECVFLQFFNALVPTMLLPDHSHLDSFPDRCFMPSFPMLSAQWCGFHTTPTRETDSNADCFGRCSFPRRKL